MRVDFKYYAHIIISSIVKFIIFVGCGFVVGKVVHINYELGLFYADYLGVDKDLCFTFISLGIANEIMILLSAFEMVMFMYLIYKLRKFKVIKYFLAWLFNIC